MTTSSAPRPSDVDLRDPAQARRAIRAGTFKGFTNAVAPGYVQGNLVIVPAKYASAFEDYCHNNPRPCPLLGISEPGSPRIPALAEDLDLRTDVGEYRIFRDGRATGTATDIRALWQEDFVAFVLGCSFSFEQELMNACSCRWRRCASNPSIRRMTGYGNGAGSLETANFPLLRSVNTMCARECVMAIGKRACSSAACAVAPQAQKTGSSSSPTRVSPCPP